MKHQSQIYIKPVTFFLSSAPELLFAYYAKLLNESAYTVPYHQLDFLADDRSHLRYIRRLLLLMCHMVQNLHTVLWDNDYNLRLQHSNPFL